MQAMLEKKTKTGKVPMIFYLDGTIKSSILGNSTRQSIVCNSIFTDALESTSHKIT